MKFFTNYFYIVYVKINKIMVTKEDFLSYYEAQMSGGFNMVMDANQVMNLYDIEKDTYWEIIRNYGKYYTEFVN